MATLRTPSPVGVVGACWYLPPERFASSTNQFLERALGHCETERRFVAMKGVSPDPDRQASAGLQWLTGHGPFLDISAYATGCAALPGNLSLYMVFNDTLFARHAWRLISRRLSTVRDSLATYPDPAAAAEVHPSTDLLLDDPHNSNRRHLSTFCLLLNNRAFHTLRRLLSALPSSEDPVGIQEWIDARMAAYPALKALLHVHLFGPRSPWSWKQDAPAVVQRKAVTVIFEYMFTAELLTAGIGMPINLGLGYRVRSRLGRHG